MISNTLKPEVYLTRCTPSYGSGPPYADSPVRQAMCRVWQAMARDQENPFHGLLAKGQSAVVKPNWVMHANRSGQGLDCLITHGSLIYWMMEWCARAMEGEGRLIVGDAPIQSCDFAALMRHTGMEEIVASIRRSYPRLDVRCEDWRLTTFARCGRQTSQDAREAVSSRYVEADLGQDSFLEEIAEFSDRFRVAMYKPSLMAAHHRPGRHQYLLRKDALEADLLVNLAKMKTHMKAGLTGAMKNLIGVNGHKEYLPHHVKGSYFRGGDSCRVNNVFARWAEDVDDRWWERNNRGGGLRRRAFALVHRTLKALALLTGGDGIHPGSWAGNDTIWRTTLDMNHLVYFGVKSPARIINVVDGIIAGEGQGPLANSPKQAGVLLVGENPAYVDAAVARLMGYNVARIPTVYHALTHRNSKFAGPALRDAPVVFADADAPGRAGLWGELENLHFRAPLHWRRAQSVSDPLREEA